MLLPWKGGASSRRRCRCSSLSSANTDPDPSSRLRLGWMFPSTSGLVVKICLANCGLATTTMEPYTGTLSRKMSPWRRAICCTIHRREIQNAAPCNAFGSCDAGGYFTAGTAGGAGCVSMVLMAVHSQHRCGTAPYHGLFRYGTVWYQVLARVETTWFRQEEAPWRRPSLTTRLRPGLLTSPLSSTRFDVACSTAWRPRSPSADTGPAPSPTSFATPARPSARSTASSPPRSSAFSSYYTSTSESWPTRFG